MKEDGILKAGQRVVFESVSFGVNPKRLEEYRLEKRQEVYRSEKRQGEEREEELKEERSLKLFEEKVKEKKDRGRK